MRAGITLADAIDAYAAVLNVACPNACPQVLMACVRALICRDRVSGWWVTES